MRTKSRCVRAGASRAAEVVPEEDDRQHGHPGEGDGDQEEHSEEE